MSTNPKKTTKRARRGDGTLPPEEFAKAIEEYKARRAQRLAAKADEGEEGVMKTPLNEARAADADEDMTPNTGTEAQAGEIDTEKQLQMVKDRRDRRDAEGDPEDKEAAIGVIAQQDGDMDILFDIIDTLLAERDFGGNTATDGTGCKKDEDDVELMEGDADDINPMPGEKENEDEDELEEGADMDEDLLEGEKIDADDETIPKATAGEPLMNADSVDYIVRQRIQLGIVGRVLNMDGLENMRIMDAKKAVIRAVRPDMRLDGKSAAYINAAFDCAVSDVKSSKRKDTSYQRKQMFNRDSRSRSDSSDAARSRMIERRLNNNKEGK